MLARASKRLQRKNKEEQIKKQERHEMLEAVHTHTHGYLANRKGITLVALIITIIVMVILAGVIIVSAVADGGVIDKAQTALKEQERAEAQEIVETSYVYKTTASQTTYESLDMPETAKAIFNNLTDAGFTLKIEGNGEIILYNEEEEYIGGWLKEFLVDEDNSILYLATEVIIGDGITSIGMNAFYKCTSLKEIILPKSMKNISNQAFWDCTSLK